MRIISQNGTLSVDIEHYAVQVQDRYINISNELNSAFMGHYESSEDALKVFRMMHRAYKDGEKVFDMSKAE